MKVIGIIPAYNESGSIERVIRDMAGHASGVQPCVVNDGSKDETSKLARRSGEAIVLDLPVNQGIGTAVQTGFLYAKRFGYDIAIQFDGDGQHKAQEIDRLLKPILEGRADVVIGSRFCDEIEGFKSTKTRRWGIKVFEIVNSLLIGQRITDNTSGFRAFNRKAIHFLAENYPFDYPEPEAVILLGKNGFRITEVPVAMKARTTGQSSINGVRSFYYMVKVLFGIFMCFLRESLKK